MESRIKIIDKTTGAEIEFASRRQVMNQLYTPHLEEYLDYSPIFLDLMERFKDVPLKKYKMTEADKRKIAANPDAINDIPRYYVPVFDMKVGNELDRKLREEFYDGFIYGKKNIVDFINETNSKYSARRA